MTPTSTEDEECKRANNNYRNRRTSHYSSYVCPIQVVPKVDRWRLTIVFVADGLSESSTVMILELLLPKNWAWDTEKFDCL